MKSCALYGGELKATVVLLPDSYQSWTTLPPHRAHVLSTDEVPLSLIRAKQTYIKTKQDKIAKYVLLLFSFQVRTAS